MALDDEENNLLEEFERGNLKSVKDLKKAKKEAIKAAEDFLKKDNRINIRLSEFDLSLIKRRAAEEGMPYQTLISSILHKYVTGRLTNKDLNK
jgi:predicted DNA binding CopG/RHH family protein